MFPVVRENAFVCGRCANWIANSLRLSYRVPRKVLNNTRLRYGSTSAVSEQPAETAPENARTPPAPKAKQGKEKYDVHLRLGGHAVRHKRADLGMPRLGKPAEIIIVDDEPSKRLTRLKNAERVRDKRQQKPEGSADEALEDFVPEVDQKLTPGEVHRNIDSLRNTIAGDANLIPSSQRKQLLETLSKGFSKRQLHYYITNALGVSQHDQTVDNGESISKTDSTIDEHIAWQYSQPIRKLARSGESKRSPRELTKLLFLVRKGGKQTLAAILVQDIWGLKTAGETESHDIPLGERKTELLRKIRSRTLDRIVRHAGAELTVSSDGKTVKLTAPSENIESLRLEIEEVLNGITTVECSVALPNHLTKTSAKELDEELIQYLRRRYSLLVTKETPDTWVITSYAENNHQVHGALREIYLTRQEAPDTDEAVVWARRGLADIDWVNVAPSDEIPWAQSRTTTWKRLSRFANNENATPGRAIVQKRFMEFVGSKLQRQFNATSSTPGITTDISASLGQTLLHQVRNPKASKTQTAMMLLKLPHGPITFARHYPRLPQILMNKKLDARERYTEIVFSPVPAQSPKSNAPDIHVVVFQPKANEHAPVLKSVHTHLSSHHFNLLLPDASTDVRFNFRIRYDLERHSDFVQHIMSLITKSSRYPTRIPPICSFPVPIPVIELFNVVQERSQPSEKGGTIKAGVPESEQQCRDIEYMAKSSTVVEAEHFRLDDLVSLQYASHSTYELGNTARWKMLTLGPHRSPTDGSEFSKRGKKGSSLAVSPKNPKGIVDFIQRAEEFASTLGR